MYKLALALGLGLIGVSLGLWQQRDAVEAIDTRNELARSGAAISVKPLREAAGEWQPLFNGRDLDGWDHLGGGQVRIQDGNLILESDAERRPGYLVSRVAACDFDARFECRLETGDSGFFFRSDRHPRTPTEVMGPQVQLNAEPGRGLGGVFELHGRGWVRRPAVDPSAQQTAECEWLSCFVMAHGSRIQISINGRKTVDFADEPGNDYLQPGVFALQIHGGGYCRMQFRNLAVRIVD
jgi:hypothetical protein